MDALIFAAGEGRRLRPLTNTVAKALVDVAGQTALERVASTLAAAGADHLIVNAHHFAQLVEDAARQLERPGLRVTVSREDLASEAPLETGGGLAFARDHLSRDEPFFLHNADILTDLDLKEVLDSHVAADDDRLATLVVTRRHTSRPLLIDDIGVCGRINRSEGWEVVCRHPENGDSAEVGFSGIHVLSPAILRHFRTTGTYSIIDVYMRLAAAGEVIGCFDASHRSWYDIGTLERLEEARTALSKGGGS